MDGSIYTASSVIIHSLPKYDLIRWSGTIELLSDPFPTTSDRFPGTGILTESIGRHLRPGSEWTTAATFDNLFMTWENDGKKSTEDAQC